MKFAFGYNTNGLAHHSLPQIIELCLKYGYQGIALTLDTHHLNPYTSALHEIQAFQKQLKQANLRVVIETGGRYLLDLERKHYPTLLHQPGAEKRLQFLEKALEVGQILGAEALSFWSGICPQEVSQEIAWQRLQDGIEKLLPKARQYQIPLALEPEPGMLIESMAQAMQLIQTFQDPFLGLTLDLGHLACVEAEPLDQYLYQAKYWIKNIHIEDIRGKIHEHLPFGEGEMNFIPLFKALNAIQYQGLINVELSRNSHNGPEQMKRSMAFLSEVEASSFSSI